MTSTPPRGAGASVADGPRRVLVGVDASSDAAAALHAGACAATAIGAELLALTAWAETPPLGVELGVDADRVVIERLQREVEPIAAVFPSLPIRTRVVHGEAARALLTAGMDADLLVVGARGRGGFPGLPLGSTAMLCVLHAPAPVLVVRSSSSGPAFDAADAPGSRRVVVGVAAATTHSAAALRDAARAAQELDASLEVVTAWQAPEQLPGPVPAVTDRVRTTAAARQAAAVREAFPDGPPPRLRETLQEGGAAAVLVAESARSDLLVVGGDSRNALTGVLLGPVALTSVMHASCPVLVVRGGRRG
ncbi:universal stress protein [Amnibacterium kyonggiense]|uniref:Nucleotide-binding universal stress UspA family protein n=1 Tax=Amnibacterium kyonggiense TaxID=595671 RepID=A0A4R7FKH6_9MICO|nr:universal stress protein [Amnibacterium kyonggiense]TDS76847.1 nucleotide-binding universal stress UspA family protein [Amnibacterium kyonggiense]